MSLSRRAALRDRQRHADAGRAALEEEGREAARRAAEVEEAQPGRVRDAAYDGREHSARSSPDMIN